MHDPPVFAPNESLRATRAVLVFSGFWVAREIRKG